MSDSLPFLPPEPPVEPEPWQCCGSGCEPCVYDRYWEDLARYEASLERWNRSQTRGTCQDPARTGADPVI